MSYSQARLRDQLGHDEPATRSEKGPCRWCQALTSIETLNALGARCEKCYEAYCQAPPPPPAPRRSRSPKPAAPVDSAAAPVELPPPVPIPALPVLDIPPLDVEREYFRETTDHDPDQIFTGTAGP